MSVTWNEECDVVIVGCGAAGLTASITAARQGLEVLVVDKSSHWGGTSALSGAGVWLPGNPLQRQAGIDDSIEKAGKFLAGVVTDEGLATTPRLRNAYLRNGLEMANMLLAEGIQWMSDAKHPDYMSDRPFAGVGRDVESRIFDAKRLGAWRATMRRSPAPYAINLSEIPLLGQGLSTLKSRWTLAKIFLRHRINRALGRDAVGCGQSLVAQLMCIAQRLGVEVRLDCPLMELVKAGDRIAGVVTGPAANLKRIHARAGVLLAAGGFAHGSFRQQHQKMDGKWSSASPEDTGDIVQMATGIGAMTAMLDEAWWGSTFVYPGDIPVFCHWERSLPFSITVDAKGRRFTNESEDYYLFGKAMISHGVDHCWLIMDGRHRKRYTFGGFFPGVTPPTLFDLGFFKTADTLDGIASACGIDARNLAATVQRFNHFADRGVDEDFQRGADPFDRYWGDPTNKPNPNLGKLEQGPFLATKIVLGDLGTKGGYVINENAQILNLRGEPIEGLYAAGNCTASIMGRTYPGPGVTLGPAMTFSYIAIQHAANSAKAPAGAAVAAERNSLRGAASARNRGIGLRPRTP